MKNTKNTLLSIAIIAALPFTVNAAQTIVETNTPVAVGANGTVKKAAATGPYQTATIGEHDDEHIATTAYVKGAYNDAIAAVNKVDDDKQVKLKNAANNNPVLPKVISSGFNGVGGIAVYAGTSREHEDEYNALVEDVTYNLTGVHDNAAALNDTLISAGTVMQWLRETGDRLNDRQNQLTAVVNHQEQNVSDAVMTAGSLGNNSYLEEIADDLVNDQADAGVVADDIERQFIDMYQGVPLVSLGGVLELIGVTAREVKSEANTELASKRVRIYTTWGTDTVTATTLVPFEMAQ